VPVDHHHKENFVTLRHFLPACILAFSFSVHATENNLAAWAEKISLNGDFRFRHDYNSKNAPADTSDRHQERFRLRLGAQAQVSEATKVKIRLASGNGDPLSANQTMTENSTKKGVFIDVAMVDYKACDVTNVYLGKMDNPLRPIGQSQLIYDADYTPEGIAAVNKLGGMFVNLGAFSLQERGPQSSTSGTSEPDSGLLAGVLGFKSDNSEGMNWMVTAGYHSFTAMKKNAALTSGASTTTAFFGNSSTGGRYNHDYQVAEIGGELKWKKEGSAYGIFVDAIQNLYIEEDNTGLLAGLQFQTLKDGKPDWTFVYAYMGLDKDATVSNLNNSDWGNGNDGGFGHMGQIAKAISPFTTASLTWYHMNVDNNGTPYGTERAFADLQISF
jgi:hypothetical protein